MTRHWTFFLFLLPVFKVVRILTPRAQIVIAKLNNDKEKLKNLIPFKWTEASYFYSGSHVEALGSEFNLTIPEYLACDPE